MIKLILQSLLCLSLTFGATVSFGQSTLNGENIARQYVSSQLENWGLSTQDIRDLKVDYQYTDDHNGVTHVYFIQRYQGIEIFNALINVNILPDGKVFHAGNRSYSNIESKINTTKPKIDREDAIILAAKKLGINPIGRLVPEGTKDDAIYFSNPSISESRIKTNLSFQVQGENQNQKLRLAWELNINDPRNADHWNIRLDALTGEILHKDNYTVYCNHGDLPTGEGDYHCSDIEHDHSVVTKSEETVVTQLSGAGNDNASYRVFAVPTQSPSHGPHVLITNPADPIASPFGWHDTNGVTGPEFTITRGNNVHAYWDRNNSGVSRGDEPRGGTTLTFDYPFNGALNPQRNKNASSTNLFYMNNALHDILYKFGFDEKSGNFQVNNYGKGGLGNDHVLAQGMDGSGTNNANFSTPVDGSSGQMQMYGWVPSGKYLTVVAPFSVAGLYDVGLASGWGTPVTSTAVEGPAVYMNDGTANPALGCSITPQDLTGKIAIIERGSCQFGTKAFNAQQKGAKAVLICNYDPGPISMAAGNDGLKVTIPVLSAGSGTCANILRGINDGLVLSFKIPANTGGPDTLDCNFDNGVIAHEFGHGVSNRLTGGPNRSNCLGNGEQMGEGWSDFQTLIFSVKPTDVGTDSKGVGTYVSGQSPTTGVGIRRFPYSTDLTKAPLTFEDVPLTNGVHALGEIWNNMTWDLFWKMVDKHGFDANLDNKTSGNFKAIQMFMDGMKLQPCSPGFTDGRDGILAADLANNNGENQCLIWEVFARRGLGFSASQGSTNVFNDGVAAFDTNPSCIKTIKISKEMSQFVVPGQEISVKLTIRNDKENTETVKVEDLLPAGCNPVAGSSNVAFNVIGSKMVFNLGDIPTGQIRTINYKLTTNPNKKSSRLYLDDMEGQTNLRWDVLNLPASANSGFWNQSDSIKRSGTSSSKVNSVSFSINSGLQMSEPVVIPSGKPTLRWWQAMNSETGNDAGTIQISTDRGNTFQALDQNKIFKNPYNSKIGNGTFGTLNQRGYSGNGFPNGFNACVADLSDYIGKEILVKFNWGCNASLATPGEFWAVDDVEIFQFENYNSEACAIDANNLSVCSEAGFRGTMVEPQITTSTEELAIDDTRVQVFPNPANDWLNVSLSELEAGAVKIKVFSSNGTIIKTIEEYISGNKFDLPISIKDLPGGVFFIQFETNSYTATRKVVKF
jgi:extracellular elastinolytic metalloproteinase